MSSLWRGKEMKYLIFLLLVSSCSNPNSFIGNCYKPYVFGGSTIKVTYCIKSTSIFNSSYCLIKVKTFLGNEYEDTILLDRLENSIQVSCEEFKNE